ncbi:hypothetical protein [Methylibium petroleiphilum]|uniref:Transmembrane protein n=1 Tax=Methylibium petroleiphilum (strain ATCC BAA-1232 / LMG 22953 / PM1) TaxID=420662 RepID=A2SMY8_METPP|nr:hypothetical protein [Methylibium petroleiphilum]ABM96927.1 hypothetical protein Mpe_B0149 [Methylibium petroleiphilum PM1]
MSTLTGGAPPTTPTHPKHDLYANAATFVASAITIWSGLQERSALLAVLGAVFLIWSAFSLFRPRKGGAGSVAHQFVQTHARRLSLAAFVVAAALTWYAFDANLMLPSVMGGLLLVATAFKLFGKKAA